MVGKVRQRSLLFRCTLLGLFAVAAKPIEIFEIWWQTHGQESNYLQTFS